MACAENEFVTLGAICNSVSRIASARERVTALYELHRNDIYRFLVGQNLEPEVAQEITQDVFVELFVALLRGSDIKSEKGWLYTVAARAAVDYWRREGTPVWISLDAGACTVELAESPQANPEHRAAERERLIRLADGIGKLTKEQRTCIQLRMHGLRYREIGRILGVSTTTVSEWLASAVERLRGEVHD